MKTRSIPQAYPDKQKNKTPDLRWGLRCGLRWGLLLGAALGSGRLGSGTPPVAAAAESSVASTTGALAFFAARWVKVLKPKQQTKSASTKTKTKIEKV